MALRYLLIAVFSVAFIAFAVADEGDVDEEQEGIEFIGKTTGAKLQFRKKGADGKKRPGFAIEADNIRQTDGQGRNVGKSIPTLTSQNFTISPLKRNELIQGIGAVNRDLRARLSDFNANFILSVNILKREGNLSFGDESFVGRKGSIKLFIKVENFTFCDGMRNDSICKRNKSGEFIEIAIGMRDRSGEKGQKESDTENNKRMGPAAPGQRRQRIRCLNMKRVNITKCPTIFNFPDGSEVALAGQCKVDGQFKPMAPGFPKVEERGQKQLFIFRCPKFNNSLVIDPMLDLPEEDEGSGDSDHASSIHFNVSLFFVMLAALFS